MYRSVCKCVNVNNVCLEAASGQGIDRHLLGLKILSSLTRNTATAADTKGTSSMSTSTGVENQPAVTHPLFQSVGYMKSTSFLLSTSNIGSTSVWGGFAPSCSNGYGACYNIGTSTITFSLTAFNQDKTTNAYEFGQVLRHCLSVMDVFVQQQQQQQQQEVLNSHESLISSKL